MRTVLFIVTFLWVLAPFTALADEEAEPEYQSLDVDGVERQWTLFLPSTYDATTPLPLVLEFHGSGSTPDAQQRMSDLPALAEERGFIIAAPKAVYPRVGNGWLTWNVDLHENRHDDVAFVNELLDHMLATYAVDPSRVYATGFSGGARMSSRVACNLAHRVAAIGPVGGVRFPEDCEPSRPVPLITFHGRQDNVNHYVHQADSPDYWRMGVEEAVAGWVGSNGCDATPEAVTLSDSDVRLDYPNCLKGGDVVFHRSETASHTWPGSPRAESMFERWQAVTADLPASELIWSFFEDHPLPSSARQSQ